MATETHGAAADADGVRQSWSANAELRPLEFYSRALEDAGFVMTSLREPHPPQARLADDPWWRQGFPVPMFLLMTARRR